MFCSKFYNITNYAGRCVVSKLKRVKGTYKNAYRKYTFFDRGGEPDSSARTALSGVAITPPAVLVIDIHGPSPALVGLLPVWISMDIIACR